MTLTEYKALQTQNKKKVRPRARPIAGTMNKLEQSYSDYLQSELMAGRITQFDFEPIKLKLATRTYYTPDFLVITPTSIEFHEVKGFWEDDARVKIKVAAKEFWWAKIIAVQKIRGRGWVFEEF